MKRTLMTKFFISALLFAGLALATSSLSAAVDGLSLNQSKKARVADQRLIGNVAAQAKREGVVVNVPQLFIYYGDTSPAYHLTGFRPTLSRELNVIIDARRMERSMVGLDRLLERAEADDGSSVSLADLPEADLYVVVYEKALCEVCDEVRDAVADWLSDRDESAFWITVSLDR